MHWAFAVRRQAATGRWNGNEAVRVETIRAARCSRYELDQLFNCTFPHVLHDDSFIWCDQGALCVYEGIVDSMWNGTSDLSMLKKVGQIAGSSPPLAEEREASILSI